MYSILAYDPKVRCISSSAIWNLYSAGLVMSLKGTSIWCRDLPKSAERTTLYPLEGPNRVAWKYVLRQAEIHLSGCHGQINASKQVIPTNWAQLTTYAKIRPYTLEKVCKNWLHRIRYCEKSRGRPINSISNRNNRTLQSKSKFENFTMFLIHCLFKLKLLNVPPYM